MAEFQTFVGANYQSASPVSDQEELINWYIERLESRGATSRAALYPTPGVESFCQVAAVGGKAMFSTGAGANERVFGIVGDRFYEISSVGIETERGTLAVDANPATICTNGDGGGQLFITSGDHGYCYDLGTNVLTEELTSGATQGGMLYGYFVAFDKANSQIRISDLFDGTAWDPTQFAARTIGSDPWQAMLVTPYGQMCLPGTQTGEFWYNSGAFPFPFQPDPSGLFAQGTPATFSIQQAGGSTVWLSTTINGGYQVMRAVGYTPQRISNHALETAISSYTRVDDAIGQTYEEDGHAFYLLTFPTVGVTWAYDFSTNTWAKRGTWISENSAYEYWRPVFHCFGFGQHLMADRETNMIYRMANSLPLDVEGRVIRRLRRSPAVVDEHKRVFHTWFELLLQVGLGTVANPNASPTVMLRVSDDGGQTWGNERDCGAGAIGATQTRVFWSRLGMARQRVYEVTVTDAVNNWRITAAYLRTKASTEGRLAA